MENSQKLIKEQLNQIKNISSQLQVKENENSQLKEEINRLSSILYDLEKQNENLKNSQKYNEDEYSMRLLLSNDEIKSLKQQKTSIKSANIELQQNLFNLNREISQKNEQIEDLISENSKYIKDNKEKFDYIKQLEQEIDEINIQKLKFKEFSNRLEKENKLLKNQLNSSVNDLNIIKKNYELFQIENKEQETLINKLKEKNKLFDEKSLKLEKEQYEHQEAKNWIFELEKKLDEINLELEKNNNFINLEKKTNENELFKFNQKIEEMKKEIEKKDKEIYYLKEIIEQEKNQQKTIENDLKNIIILCEMKKKVNKSSLDIKSDNMSINIIKNSIISMINDKKAAKKQGKRLLKAQESLINEFKLIQEKMFELNNNTKEEEIEKTSMQTLKNQLENRLNEIDNQSQNKEIEFKKYIESKQNDIEQLNKLLSDHVELLKQKEYEKAELMNLLTNKPQEPAIAVPNHNDFSIFFEYSFSIIDFLIQIINKIYDKYQNCIIIKRNLCFSINYFIKIHEKLTPIKNKNVRKFKKIVWSVIFCEILFKLWNESNIKKFKNSRNELIYIENSNFPMIKQPFITDQIKKNLIGKIFMNATNIHELANNILNLIDYKKININYVKYSLGFNDFDKLKEIFNERNSIKEKGNIISQKESFIKEFGKEIDEKMKKLSEENKDFKNKLIQYREQLDEEIEEKESIKLMLENSENKRSILIQNLKELEKHAQELNFENQRLKQN